MGKSWCRICGKEYNVCHSCEEMKLHNPWRTICETVTHYKVWLITQQYSKNIIDRDTAKQQFKGLNISQKEIDGYIPAVKEIVEKICAEDEHTNTAAAIDTKKKNNKGQG